MPDHAPNAFEAVYALMRARRYGAALELLYDREDKSLRPPYDSDSHQGWYCVGDALERQGEFSGAIAALRKALRARAGDCDTLWAIADCYAARGRPRLAERYYRRAKAHASGQTGWELMYNIANSLFDQRRYDGAAGLYRKIPRWDSELWRKARNNLRLARARRPNPPAPLLQKGGRRGAETWGLPAGARRLRRHTSASKGGAGRGATR